MSKQQFVVQKKGRGPGAGGEGGGGGGHTKKQHQSVEASLQSQNLLSILVAAVHNKQHAVGYIPIDLASSLRRNASEGGIDALELVQHQEHELKTGASHLLGQTSLLCRSLRKPCRGGVGVRLGQQLLEVVGPAPCTPKQRGSLRGTSVV